MSAISLLSSCRHLAVRGGGGLLLFRCWRRRFGRESFQAQLAPQLGFELCGDVLVVFEELLDVLAALADALALVTKPRAGFFHQISKNSQIDQIAFAGDAFAVHDVKLGFTKRGRSLVLDDLDFGAIANDRVSVLDGCNAADVSPNG